MVTPEFLLFGHLFRDGDTHILMAALIILGALLQMLFAMLFRLTIRLGPPLWMMKKNCLIPSDLLFDGSK